MSCDTGPASGKRTSEAARVRSHLLRALHISMVTRTESAMVMGYGDSKTEHWTPANSEWPSEH